MPPLPIILPTCSGTDSLLTDTSSKKIIRLYSHLRGRDRDLHRQPDVVIARGEPFLPQLLEDQVLGLPLRLGPAHDGDAALLPRCGRPGLRPRRSCAQTSCRGGRQPSCGAAAASGLLLLRGGDLYRGPGKFYDVANMAPLCP